MALSEVERPPISFNQLGIRPPENNLRELDAPAFYDYLGALFQLRESLVSRLGDQSEDLAVFDATISSVLMTAVKWSGLSCVMGKAYLLGLVDNPADVLPIIEPRLRAYYESLKLGNEERLDNIPVIGVVGKIASGKGTVAEILDENFDVMSFPFSDRLRAIALAMGFRPPYTRKQLRSINDIYKPAFGNQIFVEWTLIRAARMTESLHVPEIIVTDGFRSVEETEYFLKKPNTHLVAIIASHNVEEDRRIRFERQSERRRGAEDSQTMAEFMKDDGVESIWIDPVIELAQEKGLMIINDGDLNNLSSNVMSTLAGVLSNIPKD